MSSDSEYQGKIDAFDLIMNVLKEYEKSLDGLVQKLEKLVNEPAGAKETVRKAATPTSSVQYADWADFKEKSSKARLVTFDADEDTFQVNSISDEGIQRYSELLPRIRLHFRQDEDGLTLDRLSVKSLTDLLFFFEKRLSCGLGVGLETSKIDLSAKEHVVQLTSQVDPDEAKLWLCTELNLPQEKVKKGRISFRDIPLLFPEAVSHSNWAKGLLG